MIKKKKWRYIKEKLKVTKIVSKENTSRNISTGVQKYVNSLMKIDPVVDTNKKRKTIQRINEKKTTHSNCRHFSKHHKQFNKPNDVCILYFYNRFSMPYTRCIFEWEETSKIWWKRYALSLCYLKVQILIFLVLSEYKEENFYLRDFRFVNVTLQSATNGSWTVNYEYITLCGFRYHALVSNYSIYLTLLEYKENKIPCFNY